MSPEAPARDLAGSRAVLIGTWDYTHLPAVPAARHSLERMHALLTGELCGWPADRVTVIANRRTPGDLYDLLVEEYGATDPDGVALFYFVGHGQPDESDRLCLALGETRSESRRRASTSLRFDDVRDGIRSSDAGTRIVILDCCFSGLAARSPRALSPGGVLDMTRGTGAYTMAASGAYLPAWFETDERVVRPQTYFTRYLADVVESGIAGQPAGLTLDRVFAEVSDRLVRDGRPEPTSTVRHEAGRYVFARNAAPVVREQNLAARLEERTRQLAEAEAREAELRARYEQAIQQLRDKQAAALPQPGAEPAVPESPEVQHAARDAYQAASEAVAAHRLTQRASRDLAELGQPTPGAPEPVPTAEALFARLAGASPQTRSRTLLEASGGDEAAVAELAALLRESGNDDAAVELVQLAAQRPLDQVARIAKLLEQRPVHATPPDFPTIGLGGVGTTDWAEHSRRTMAAVRARTPLEHLLVGPAGSGRGPQEVADLAAMLVADGTDAVTYLLNVAGWQRPVDEVYALVVALRAHGMEQSVSTVLTRAGWREVDVLESLITTLHSHGWSNDIHAVLRGMAQKARQRSQLPSGRDRPYPDGPLTRAEAVRLADALRASDLDEESWNRLVRVPTRGEVARQRVRERLHVADWRTGTIVWQLATFPVVAFLLGAASLPGAPDGLWPWAKLVVSVVVAIGAVGFVRSALDEWLLDNWPTFHGLPGPLSALVTVLALAAGRLATAWPPVGALGETLYRWLLWQF